MIEVTQHLSQLTKKGIASLTLLSGAYVWVTNPSQALAQGAWTEIPRGCVQQSYPCTVVTSERKVRERPWGPWSIGADQRSQWTWQNENKIHFVKGRFLLELKDQAAVVSVAKISAQRAKIFIATDSRSTHLQVISGEILLHHWSQEKEKKLSAGWEVHYDAKTKLSPTPQLFPPFEALRNYATFFSGEAKLFHAQARQLASAWQQDLSKLSVALQDRVLKDYEHEKHQRYLRKLASEKRRARNKKTIELFKKKLGLEGF